MTFVLNSPQERQRLMSRIDYLRRQYETLRQVADILTDMTGSSHPAQLADDALKDRLEQQRTRIADEDVESSRRALGQIGGALYEAQEKLHESDTQVSVFQIRTRFQRSEASRDELALLLQFLLSKLNFTDEDLDKIDYLTTRFYALSVRSGSGFAFENRVRQDYQRMLDYAGITRTDVPDPEGMEILNFLREELSSATSLQQLTSMATLDRLRAFKAGLQNRRLHPDVMLELARVNLLAGERFEQLAGHESRKLNKLATQLLSAGVSEVEESRGEGLVAVEEVWKNSQRDASQLNDDYRHNRQRIERLTQASDALSRAHERLGLPDPPDESQLQPERQEAADTSAAEATSAEITPKETAFEKNPSSASGICDGELLIKISSAEITTPAAISGIKGSNGADPGGPCEPNPTPATFRDDLCVRLRQIHQLLGERDDAEAGLELSFERSAIVLAPWEAAAFQRNHPGLSVGESSLGSLLRLSVALMAELRERQESICAGLASPELRGPYLGGARYLEQFGLQTLREIGECVKQASEELPQEISSELQQTHFKLAGVCAQFSTRLGNALI